MWVALPCLDDGGPSLEGSRVMFCYPNITLLRWSSRRDIASLFIVPCWAEIKRMHKTHHPFHWTAYRVRSWGPHVHRAFPSCTPPQWWTCEFRYLVFILSSFTPLSASSLPLTPHPSTPCLFPPFLSSYLMDHLWPWSCFLVSVSFDTLLLENLLSCFLGLAYSLT